MKKMAYETITVDIFETTAILNLDAFRDQETKPMYAAMVPGSESYYCFTGVLGNLPKELALVAGSNTKVIPRNLHKEEYFRNIKFGGSEQAVLVLHKPLSPSKLEDFISAAIWEISWGNELRRRDEDKNIQKKINKDIFWRK